MTVFLSFQLNKRRKLISFNAKTERSFKHLVQHFSSNAGFTLFSIAISILKSIFLIIRFVTPVHLRIPLKYSTILKTSNKIVLRNVF